MALKDMDSGYKYRALGAALVILGVISGFIGYKTNTTFYYILFLFLNIFGVILASFGLTKIKVKGDKDYQEYLQKTNKQNLIFFPITIGLVIVGVIIQSLTKNFWIPIILLMISIVPASYVMMNTYTTIFKAVDYSSNLPKKNRKKAYVMLIIMIALALLLMYLIKTFLLPK